MKHPATKGQTMAKSEKLIFVRNQWEIARTEVDAVTGKLQWIRRDMSYICDVGTEKAKMDMPPKPD
jgi:hypothetical protein